MDWKEFLTKSDQQFPTQPAKSEHECGKRVIADTSRRYLFNKEWMYTGKDLLSCDTIRERLCLNIYMYALNVYSIRLILSSS